MSKKKYEDELTIKQIIKPMNPEALNWVSWFMTDANNLRQWATEIFNNSIDLSTPRSIELVNAAELLLSEVEEDIAKIREFLTAYIPPNNN